MTGAFEERLRRRFLCQPVRPRTRLAVGWLLGWLLDLRMTAPPPHGCSVDDDKGPLGAVGDVCLNLAQGARSA
jgi:hypothetical protein